MRLLVVFALACVVAVQAFPPMGMPMGGGGYYGAGSGMENGFGGQGHLNAGGMNNGIYDNADSGYRRIEEGHNTRNFGAHNNMGGVNQGGGQYGYGRGGSNMYGGGGGGMGMGMGMGGLGMG